MKDRSYWGFYASIAVTILGRHTYMYMQFSSLLAITKGLSGLSTRKDNSSMQFDIAFLVMGLGMPKEVSERFTFPTD